MNWLKLPNVKADANGCGVRICWSRGEESFCGINICANRFCIVNY